MYELERTENLASESPQVQASTFLLNLMAIGKSLSPFESQSSYLKTEGYSKLS